MLKELSYIKLSGNHFPMKMDNLVLQEVQQEYGTLKNFEMRLIGAIIKKGETGELKIVQREPDISVMNFVLPKMIREGYAVLEEECEYTDDDIVRMIDENMYVMAEAVHEEYRKCILVKDPKKQNPSQTKKKKRLSLIGCIMSAVRSWALQRRK